MTRESLDVVRGTLDLILLKTLSWGPMHGVGIIRWIEDVTQRQLLVEEGALYPALHRLEAHGWLSAEWGTSDSGRRAKFYSLTPSGRKQFVSESNRWNRYAVAMSRILAAQGAP